MLNVVLGDEPWMVSLLMSKSQGFITTTTKIWSNKKNRSLFESSSMEMTLDMWLECK